MEFAECGGTGVGNDPSLASKTWRIIMQMSRWLIVVATIPIGMSLSLSTAKSAEPKPFGPDPQKWERLVDKGIEYLRTSQAPDGSWSAKQPMGVTGIALTGLLRTGRVKAEDPTADKA